MANSRQRQLLYDEPASVADGTETPKETGEDMRQVPQPSEDAVQEDERASISSVRTPYSEVVKSENGEGVGGPFSSFFNLFKNNDPPKEEAISEKQKRIYSMSQTLQVTDDSSSAVASSDTEAPPRPMMVTTGHELEEDEGGMKAPLEPPSSNLRVTFSTPKSRTWTTSSTLQNGPEPSSTTESIIRPTFQHLLSRQVRLLQYAGDYHGRSHCSNPQKTAKTVPTLQRGGIPNHRPSVWKKRLHVPTTTISHGAKFS
uniref:Uncharacterized protein n=1 Tax=Bionectria ochroleuca TaxID=29856 RepID=A0A8H7NNG3_BIOOC